MLTRYRQAWCSLQVKLCDPCLSALKWFVPCNALCKCSDVAGNMKLLPAYNVTRIININKLFPQF